MIKHPLVVTRQILASAGIIFLLGLGLSQGAALAKSRESKLRDDARTCESFGARYGTSTFSNCMLEQQRRRDTKQLESLEKTRLTSQIAKDGQIMAERARRQRCDRNPDRRECGR